jgi:predicted nucleic acid-binding protein
VVPDIVVGEAFTKLRYDKRVSPRRDAGIALTAFAMTDGNPDTFVRVATPASAHAGARTILTRYRDHAFSYVDAVIFHLVERDASITGVLTVDGLDFRSLRFGHPVDVITP